MKKGLAAIVAASSVLLLLVLAVILGVPRSASAQTPLTISTVGLTCTNGVCVLGTGNVGTFLDLAISASGGSGTSTGPDQWRGGAPPPPARAGLGPVFWAGYGRVSGAPP